MIRIPKVLEDKVDCKVFSLDGQIVHAEVMMAEFDKPFQNHVDLSYLPNGMYVFNIKAGSQSYGGLITIAKQ